MLGLERLEERLPLTGFTAVELAGGALMVNGGANDTVVEIQQVGRQLQVTTTEDVDFSTSFENLAGDRSDVPNLVLGEGLATATFSGGVAGTRGFPPGYNNGAFAFITSGQSQIDFATPAHAQFAARDIVEFPGAPNVVGVVTLIGQNGSVQIDVTDNGDPQSGNWDVIDSRDFNVGALTRIVIDNNDANGNPTGVTNIDDFSFQVEDAQQTFNFQARAVRNIFASLGAGDDTLINSSRKRLVALGGDGDDVLLGGRGRDTLIGGAGDDVMMGGRGRDRLIGGAGDDVLLGERGRDTLIGGKGDDVMLGGGGRDVLSGGKGDDYLDGGSGRDVLFGGKGDDVLLGGSGRDVLRGGAGYDYLDGGRGRDRVFADSFDEIINDRWDRVINRGSRYSRSW